MRFAGKVALVTSETPIGHAVAHLLKAEGATVVLADAAFLTTQAAWDTLLETMAADHGRLDVLVTYAAAAYAQPISIAETTLAQFRAVTGPNLEGAFLATRATILKMRAFGNGGSIVHIASAFATIGLAGQAAYNASANGIRMMTKTAALACAEAKDNIRVNAVQVGGVAGTPRGSANPPIPLGEKGSAENVAATVAYLASADAAYVTGFVLPVDGGLLAA